MPDDALQGSASLSVADPAVELAMALLGAAHRSDDTVMAHLLHTGVAIDVLTDDGRRALPLVAADGLFGRGAGADLHLRSLVSEPTSVACEIVATADHDGPRRQEGLFVAHCTDGRIARALLYLGPVTVGRGGRVMAGGLDRDALRALAIDRYFSSVDAKDLKGVLACFHDDAVFSIGTAAVQFHGKAEIGRMLTDYFAGFEHIEHRDFTTIVDVERQSIAAHFDGFLQTADGQETRLHNSNVWHLRDGLFERVTVYMSGANVLK